MEMVDLNKMSKEAEDNKPPYACCSFNTDCELWKDGFQKGATFGYNKANEWNFVKDGKHPTHENKVLCILGDFENDNLEVGYYCQKDNKKEKWRFEDYDLPDDSEDGWGVSAWKEIILPELKESE